MIQIITRLSLASIVISIIFVSLDIDARTVSPGMDLDGVPCKSFRWPSGALDFRIKTKNNLWHYQDSWINHIKPALDRMNTEYGKGVGGSVSGNLEFVLTRRPNDTRALKEIIDYSFIIKRHPRHVPLARKPECYLKSAILFQPDDPTPRLLFGYYFMRLKKYIPAIKKYEESLRINPDMSEAYYNIGLAYFRIRKYKDAAAAAKKAYHLGFPLHFLKNALAKKGYAVDMK